MSNFILDKGVFVHYFNFCNSANFNSSRSMKDRLTYDSLKDSSIEKDFSKRMDKLSIIYLLLFSCVFHLHITAIWVIMNLLSTCFGR